MRYQIYLRWRLPLSLVFDSAAIGIELELIDVDASHTVISQILKLLFYKFVRWLYRHASSEQTARVTLRCF